MVRNRFAVMSARTVLRQDSELPFALRTPRHVVLQRDGNAHCLHVVARGDDFTAVCRFVVQADNAATFSSFIKAQFLYAPARFLGGLS